MTIQIKAPHFTAGVIVKDRAVVTAAPIIKYMIGWKYIKVLHYCDEKGWKYEFLVEVARPPKV